MPAQPLVTSASADMADVYGRRLRCFAKLVLRSWQEGGLRFESIGQWGGYNKYIPVKVEGLTWLEAMNEIDERFDLSDARGAFCRIPFRTLFRQTTVYRSIPNPDLPPCSERDAELHCSLQDLAWAINHDIVEACDAFENPDVHYPGVDRGIEPVPDTHVDLVIWALQRELNRELRTQLGHIDYARSLPPVPLAKFPRRIQRALVERRRLRFAQWGIGRKEWETNTWSLWNVPLDPSYYPPKPTRY